MKALDKDLRIIYNVISEEEKINEILFVNGVCFVNGDNIMCAYHLMGSVVKFSSYFKYW